MRLEIFYDCPETYAFPELENIEELKDVIEYVHNIKTELQGSSIVVNATTDVCEDICDTINRLKYESVNGEMANSIFTSIKIEGYEPDTYTKYLENSIKALQAQSILNNQYIHECFGLIDEKLSKLDTNQESVFELMNKDGIFKYKQTTEYLLKVIEKHQNIDLNNLRNLIFKQEN